MRLIHNVGHTFLAQIVLFCDRIEKNIRDYVTLVVCVIVARSFSVHDRLEVVFKFFQLKRIFIKHSFNMLQPLIEKMIERLLRIGNHAS